MSSSNENEMSGTMFFSARYKLMIMRDYKRKERYETFSYRKPYTGQTDRLKQTETDK